MSCGAEVVTLSADDTLAVAAARFMERGISGAPVVNSQQKCVGVLSATDFVRQVGEHSAAAGQSGKQWVEAHMSRPPVSIRAGAR